MARFEQEDILPPEPATTDLVKDVVAEVRELAKVELELAKDELRGEIARAKTAAIGFGLAAATTSATIAVLAVAVVLAIAPVAWAALVVAFGLLVITGAAAAFGYAMLPKEPLPQTRKRLESDVKHLKEHLA